MKVLAIKPDKLSSSPKPTVEGENCLLRVLQPSHSLTAQMYQHTQTLDIKEKETPGFGWMESQPQKGRGKNPKNKQDNK